MGEQRVWTAIVTSTSKGPKRRMLLDYMTVITIAITPSCTTFRRFEATATVPSSEGSSKLLIMATICKLFLAFCFGDFIVTCHCLVLKKKQKKNSVLAMAMMMVVKIKVKAKVKVKGDADNKV